MSCSPKKPDEWLIPPVNISKIRDGSHHYACSMNINIVLFKGLLLGNQQHDFLDLYLRFRYEDTLNARQTSWFLELLLSDFARPMADFAMNNGSIGAMFDYHGVDRAATSFCEDC